MRLLNVQTFRLQEFFGSNTPSYAILSHTWGTDEVLYQDVTNNASKLGGGTNANGSSAQPCWSYKENARKIIDSAALAAQKGYKYIWIDTCCIDKTSSAELSEAINSMFEWYARAAVCFVYLVDFTLPRPGTYQDRDLRLRNLHESRWFCRGWTLQELIAPEEVHFYDKDWHFIGTRDEISQLLHRITSIAMTILDSRITRTRSQSEISEQPDLLNASLSLLPYSVSEKMQWAAGRETTREEDLAYSLLGIFDIKMPLLYGEGKKAFARLQRKILKQTNDQSIFVFDRQKAFDDGSFFACSTLDFKTNLKVRPFRGSGRRVAVHQNELLIELLLCPLANKPGRHLGILHCCVNDECAGITRPAVILIESDGKFSFDPAYNIHLVRPSDKLHAVNFPGFKSSTNQLRIDLDEVHQGVITIHPSTQLASHRDSVWNIPIHLNPVQGDSSARYQFGPTYPARTGIMVRPANLQFGVSGSVVWYAICVERIKDRLISYPLVIICTKHLNQQKPVTVLVSDPQSVPCRYREDPLSEQEVHRLIQMDPCLPSADFRAEGTDVVYQNSTTLKNGDNADVKICENDFLGVPFYDLNIVITKSSRQVRRARR